MADLKNPGKTILHSANNYADKLLPQNLNP